MKIERMRASRVDDVYIVRQGEECIAKIPDTWFLPMYEIGSTVEKIVTAWRDNEKITEYAAKFCNHA